jgi:hypothetical protein
MKADCASGNVISYSASNACTGASTSVPITQVAGGAAANTCTAAQGSGTGYYKYSCMAGTPDVTKLPAGIVSNQYSDAGCTTLMGASVAMGCTKQDATHGVTMTCDGTTTTTSLYNSATCSGGSPTTQTGSLAGCASAGGGGIYIKQTCNAAAAGGGSKASGAGAAAVAAFVAAAAAAAAAVLA